MISSLKKALNSPAHVLLGLAITLITFNVGYYIMSHFPALAENSCTSGGYLTVGGLVYVGAFSLLLGMFIITSLILIQNKVGSSLTFSISGIGTLIAALTTFCTICTLPALGLFGISVGLGIFSIYNWQLRLLSLILLISALYLNIVRINNRCVLGVCEPR